MKKITKTLLIWGLVLFVGTKSMAQSNATLYNMKTIPQRINANPALMSDAKNFLGFPVISSNYFAFGNSAFSGNTILSLVEEVTPDSSVINLSKLSDIFEKSNFVSFEYNVDLLSFGFKVKKKNYIYLTSSLSNQFRLTYPGDFFALLSEGNGGKNINREFDFAFGVDFMQYVDLGLGYSRKFMDDRLTIGARYRILKGLNIINTEKNEITFKTDPNTFDLTVKSDIKINSASSFIKVDSLGSITNINQDSITANSIFDKNNRGSAIDIGVEFKLNKKITLSAAVNNIGKITWNKNTFNLQSETPGATYTYSGIHFDDVFNESGTDIEGAIQKVGDTLKEKFKLVDRSESFTTKLFAEFYLGGNYNFSKDHNAGALIYGTIYQQKIQPSLTLSWNSKLTNLFAISASYTVRQNNYFNAGLGVSVNGGPFQVYFVSDNIGGLLAPNDVKNVNFRAGFNLAMQRKDLDAKAKKKAEKAKKKAAKKAAS